MSKKIVQPTKLIRWTSSTNSTQFNSTNSAHQFNHVNSEINEAEINGDSRTRSNTGSQVRFVTLILWSRLCDYSDAYILVKGTIIVTNIWTAALADNRNKKVMFKNFATFTDCISERNNREIDHTKDIDVVMLIYNLIQKKWQLFLNIRKFIEIL